MKINNRELTFNRTLIMGVLNSTPDSFSDGGQFTSFEKAVNHSLNMLDDGADILDIGGESTRPGSDPVSATEEISRVVPLIQKIKEFRPDCIISIDTQKPEVAEEAVKNGADIINDVSGLQYSKEIASITAKYKTGLILMHMLGTPKTMQYQINYNNLLSDIKTFLSNAAKKAISLGVKKEQIVLDPGIGFGKTLENNLEILSNILSFKNLGFPVLIGPSRKAFIGKILNENSPSERDWGTAGLINALAMQKTDIVRVHDVKHIRQSLTMFEIINKNILPPLTPT